MIKIFLFIKTSKFFSKLLFSFSFSPTILMLLIKFNLLNFEIIPKLKVELKNNNTNK